MLVSGFVATFGLPKVRLWFRILDRPILQDRFIQLLIKTMRCSGSARCDLHESQAYFPNVEMRDASLSLFLHFPGNSGAKNEISRLRRLTPQFS